MYKKHLKGVRPNDYVVVRAPRSPTQMKDVFLAMRVTDTAGSSDVTGELVKNCHWEPKSFTVPQEEIVANFGRKPPPVTVAGVNLDEIFDKHELELDHFGHVFFSFKPDELALERVQKSYDRGYKWLKSIGLAKIAELNGVHEATHRASKYVGYVKSSKDLTKKPYFLRTTPLHQSFDSPLYVMSHELAHVIHLQVLSRVPKVNQAWLEVYAETVKAKQMEKGDAQGMLDAFLDSPKPWAIASSFEDEEHKEFFKTIVGQINRTRRVSWKDLLVLHAAGAHDTIRHFWPASKHVIASELKPAVSEYALTNVRELFAESVSFMAVGKKIPKHIESLVEASLSRAVKELPLLLKDLDDDNGS